MRRSGLLAVCLIFLPIHLYAQGPLLWELQQDIDGGFDFARAIELSGKSAVVVGNGGVPLEGTDESDFVIEAISRTGAVRWSDQTFLSIGVVDSLFLTTRQKRAYAVGTLYDGDPLGSFLVRAYDVPTGESLWQNVWHGEQGLINWNPTGIVAGPTHVVVIGYGDNATKDGLAALVRAYDPLTGAILWEDRVGTTGVDVIPWAIAANRNRVFVVGSTSTGLFSRDLFARAYDAVSGAVEWEISREDVSPVKVKLESSRLLVAGSTANSTYLAAFSTETGVLLWQDMTPTEGGIVMDIAAKGSRIVAAIVSGLDSVVRVYDLITGDRWEDHLTAPTGFHVFFSSVELNETTVYAAGHFGEDFGDSEFMVRAYDARTRTLLWDDRSHPSPQTTVVDLALTKSLLLVAGSTSDGSTSSDFLIRAYDARSSRRRGPGNVPSAVVSRR